MSQSFSALPCQRNMRKNGLMKASFRGIIYSKAVGFTRFFGKKDGLIMSDKSIENLSERILKNPIDDGWYADPEARIYEGMYVIYATRSLPFDEQKNQVCFTSADLVNWEGSVQFSGEKRNLEILVSSIPWGQNQGSSLQSTRKRNCWKILSV